MQMQHYIGTKTLDAVPMTRGGYNAYRGWQTQAGEDLRDEGYLVEYAPDGKPNDPRHAGYISWTPKGSFDAAYLRLEGAELHNLPPHVQRMAGEYVQLMDKYTKLGAYLARGRVADELMLEQHLAMGLYAALLKARIDGRRESQKFPPARRCV